MNVGVFLDRDGTINEQMGYINHISRFHMLPGAVEGIALLNRRGLKVVVVSNQSGPARGYFPEQLIQEVNDRMVEELSVHGAYIDGIFYCPHHKDAVVAAYRVECECRKPKIGLLTEAAKELDIDVSRSYVVGDRLLDVELARNAGARGILVLTGYGKGELVYKCVQGHAPLSYVAEDLLDAAQWIIRDLDDR